MLLACAGLLGTPGTAQEETFRLTPQLGFALAGAYFGPMRARSAASYTDATIDLTNMPLAGVAVSVRLPRPAWRLRAELVAGRAEIHSEITSGTDGGEGGTWLYRRHRADATVWRLALGLEHPLPVSRVRLEGSVATLLARTHVIVRQGPSPAGGPYYDGGVAAGLSFGPGTGTLRRARLGVRGVLLRTSAKLFHDLRSQTLGSSDRSGDWLPQLELLVAWHLEL